MKERPFNLHDVGLLPPLYCKHCGAVLECRAQREPEGKLLGFLISHPSNDCKHSQTKTAMPVITLAEVVLRLNK